MKQQQEPRRKSFTKEKILPYIMTAPAMAFLLVFTFYPMANLIYLSFFDYNLINPNKRFVGWRNYYELFFVRKDFLNALQNTAVYTGAVVFFVILLALLLALWIRKDSKFNHFVQTCAFTPHLVAMLSCAMIWAWIMDANRYGLFNTVLSFFNLPPLRWLNSSATAMLSVVIVSVWKSIGYYCLIIVSALKAIPAEIYEAAELDNTPRYRLFFRIILPLLSPQLFFLLVTITINSFKVFDTVRVMTEGGPGNATDVISFYIYRYAFRHFRIGYASAAGTVLMVILMLLTAVYFRGLSRRVHYQ
jgi:sn-glycerol 3-phosphate transport system permease protein